MTGGKKKQQKPALGENFRILIQTELKEFVADDSLTGK
jgi:hypothetical protein